MALNTPLLGAVPDLTNACFLGGSSVAVFTNKLPVPSHRHQTIPFFGLCLGVRKNALFLGVGKKRSAVMTQKSTSTEQPNHLRATSDSFIVVNNGDDFAYGFGRYICEMRGLSFEVCRNDEVTVDGLRRKNPRGLFLSPGPGMPQDSGVSMQAIRELGPTIPIFGVCLGLQCIGEVFGGKIVSVPSDLLRKESCKVYFNRESEMCLFDNFYRPFVVTQHDNHVIDKETFPHDELEITAWMEDGLVMAARHKKYSHIQGIQFIPERVVMDEGKRIIFKFIKFVEAMEVKAKEALTTSKLAKQVKTDMLKNL